MIFCSQCGQGLVEGTSHQCLASNAPPTVSVSLKPPQSTKVDFQVLLGILKNPMNALKLDASQGGLVYGLIGIGISLVGFLLYALALKRALINTISSAFGDFGDFFGRSFSGGIADRLSLGWNALWIGLISWIVLLATYWFVGNAITKKKLDYLDFMTKVGAFQLIFGIAFVLGALLSFISFTFSVVVILVSLILALVCNNIIVLQMYRVQDSKQLKLSVISVGIYSLIMLVVLQLIV